MDDTARSESAQALFCAIADLVGRFHVDKVLNLKTFPTYKDFKAGKVDNLFITGVFPKNNTNQKRIEEAAKYIDTTADLAEIEKFLTGNKAWYKSSVNIAGKLIKKLHTKGPNDIFKGFSDLSYKGFLKGKNSIYYLRGDREVMMKFDECFKLANNNTNWSKLAGQTRFGDINKWSPADIYYADKDAKKQIADHLTAAKKNIASNSPNYSFSDLNPFVSFLISTGQLLPLSLKKQVGSVSLQLVNFDTKALDKEINGAWENRKFEGGLWYHSIDDYQKWKTPLSGDWSVKRQSFPPFEPLDRPNMGAYVNTDTPTRDIKIYFSKSLNGSKAGHIQIRHDASAGGLKVDFRYTSSGARAGSLASHAKFGEILTLVNKTVGEAFTGAWTAGATEWKEEYLTNFTNPIFKNLLCSGQCPGGGSHIGLKKHQDMIKALWQAKYVDPSSLTGNKKIDSWYNGPFSKQDTKPNPFSDLRGELSAITIFNRIGPVIYDWATSTAAQKRGKKAHQTNEIDRLIRILYQYMSSQTVGKSGVSSGKFVIAK